MKNSNFFHFILVVAFYFFAGNIKSQVVWSEDFSYTDGTVVGANNNTSNPSPDWTSSCGTCLAGDYFEVRAGAMKNSDSNGPTFFETEIIDVSSLLTGFQISLDVVQIGDFEACGTGCNSVDFTVVQYSLDGGPWITDLSGPGGGYCAGACADLDVTASGDHGDFTLVICPLTANSVQIRVSNQTWAANEASTVDNITVEGQSCLMPIEWGEFAIEASENTSKISWESYLEENCEGFTIMKKAFGEADFQAIGWVSAEGNAHSYEFIDYDNNLQDGSFYQVVLEESDQSQIFGPVLEYNFLSTDKSLEVYPNPVQDKLNLRASNMEIQHLLILDLQGRVVKDMFVDDQSVFSIDLFEVAKGVYQYSCVTNTGIFNGKFIKN